MTGTNLQRKRSEHGASLILLVSIIGLAFIVTVAAFLLAASNAQDTARLATAKVDIANREDILIREILQQTATGMPSGTNWTTIMTTAVNNIDAINYVDLTELARLGITGVIPANAGDTGGANPLSILQGYNQTEVPLGGTSGVANDISQASPPTDNPSLYNATVLPPLMNWSNSNATLSLSTAVTTPQEFFLGSLNTVSTPPTQSSGNRWAKLPYPATRFGYKQPSVSGSPNYFIARRVWWTIPVVYQTTQQTEEAIKAGTNVKRYPSAPANYVLSVYEIPSQLPISGNADLQIGGTAWGSGISVTGSISTSGNQIQLYGGTYNGVSSRQKVPVINSTTVGGVTYSSDSTGSAFDQLGTREQMALTQTPGAAAPVAVTGNDGKVLIMPVLPLRNGALSPNDFYMAAPGTPTHWDLYARPYYRCRIRIIISGTDSNLIYNSLTGVTNTAAGKITVQIIAQPDAVSKPDQILGFLDSAATLLPPITQTSIASPNPKLVSYGMNYTSTNKGKGPPPGNYPLDSYDRNILVIDIPTMITALIKALGQGSPAQLYSIYIGSNPTIEPAAALSTTSDPGIAITDTHDLSAFTRGLSIVTNQTLYLLDAFNQGPPPPPLPPPQPPTSIYAPQIRYSISVIPQVNLTGQVAVVPTPGPTPVNPLSFTSGNGTSISSSNIIAKLTEVTDPTPWSVTSPTGLPPITALSLLFTVEKEQN